MDYLSSMFIDNEMDLFEKKQFVEKIRSEREFYTLTLELLTQEQRIQKQPIMPELLPEREWQMSAWGRLLRSLKPLGFAASGFAAAVLMFFVFFQSPVCPVPNNRFVLFEPAATQVELTGSFTGWHRVSMKQIGNSGYWELNLPVAIGEHRFAYILDNNRRIIDPTIPASEKDDLGGKNSILTVEKHL